MPFYEKGAAKGGFEAGVRTALEAILASPHFIFRLENEPPTDARRAARIASPTSTSPRACRSSSGARRRIRNCSTLAGRRASCRRPAALEKQARRMLADPRADALGTRFAAQWLRLQDVDKVHPDPNFYPNFDDNLADAMRARDRAVLQQPRPRGPQPARSLSRRLHVRERAARAALRHPGRRRRRVPPRHLSGRHAPRPARPGQRAGADLARQPHVAGAARQVGDGSAARHAAAAAAAGRPDARRDGRREGRHAC